MDMTIDVSSAEPVYEQIVRQVHAGIREGRLAQGTPLPPIRQLASDLELNPNTVAKAYKMLEADHVILTAGKKGSFVSNDATLRIEQLNRQQAAYQMTTLLDCLRQRGMTLEQIKAAFDTAVAGLLRTPKGTI